jgi:hypothetical protein
MLVPNGPRAALGVTVMSVAVTAAAAMVVVSAAGQPSVPVDLPGVLARIGERVEAYYARAQSIICTETLRVERLSHSLVPEPHARVLVYELRVSREAATDAYPQPEASVVRLLKKVNGRVPKPKDDPDCLDPYDVSLDPLSFLLPHHQREYKFSYKGNGRVDGRQFVMIDYAPASAAPIEATWRDGCVSIDAPARTTGRLWIDPATGDVQRLDEQVRGPISLDIPKPQRQLSAPDSLTLERAVSSIRYKPVTFTDPDETVMLPESFENLSVSAGTFSSIRMTHRFTGYQRFVTGGRIIQ